MKAQRLPGGLCGLRITLSSPQYLQDVEPQQTHFLCTHANVPIFSIPSHPLLISLPSAELYYPSFPRVCSAFPRR